MITRHSVEMETRHKPEHLCALVADVRAYPRFLPWIRSMKVRDETEAPDGAWEGVATAEIGWKLIKERFSTRVRRSSDHRRIEVDLVHGPFRHLQNRWRFEPEGAGARVRFDIDFEFSSPILQKLLSANMNAAARVLMRAFMEEADRRYPLA